MNQRQSIGDRSIRIDEQNRVLDGFLFDLRPGLKLFHPAPDASVYHACFS